MVSKKRNKKTQLTQILKKTENSGKEIIKCLISQNLMMVLHTETVQWLSTGSQLAFAEASAGVWMEACILDL